MKVSGTIRYRVADVLEFEATGGDQLRGGGK
jgi:hypothetical protein